MRMSNVAIGCLALILLAAVGMGAASAEETGPSAWCFRPSVFWIPVTTEAYVPQIRCEQRELPRGGEQWSSEITAELAVAPDGWSLPTRSQGERTRWGWTHGYNASSGDTWIYGEMKRTEGRSPAGSTAPPNVYLSVGCSTRGLWLSLASDVDPLHGRHAVVWWTDASEYRRAESWETEETAPGSEFFRAWAPSPEQLWAEIRESTWLYVLVFGDQSWQMAEAFVSRINQLDVLRTLDYCGQDQRVEPATGG